MGPHYYEIENKTLKVNHAYHIHSVKSLCSESLFKLIRGGGETDFKGKTMLQFSPIIEHEIK